MQRDVDVLVAGAGPVGLIAAHALATQGVPVGIVDTGVWACSHSYALALHPHTVELLRRAGLADAIVANGNVLKRIAFYDREKQRATVDLAGEAPMIVLPQSALETELESALERAGVHVEWRHKVAAVQAEDGRARVTLNRYEKESRGYVIARSEWALTKTYTVDVPFVVGADGYDSAVRHSLAAQFPEVAPSAYYAVFEFRSDAAVADEVRVVLGKDTTDVLWPLGQRWFRWGFHLPEYTDPEVERLAAYRERYGDPSDRYKDRTVDSEGDVDILPDSRLRELIAERAPWFAGIVEDIGWRTVVRFERRLTTSFGRGACWLAGDSAHLGNPIGVHSLNVGIAEAIDLGSMLSASVKGETVPDGYDRRWQNEWRRLLAEPEATPGADPWVRDNRHRIVPCLPGYGDALASMAAQLGLRV